MIKEGNLTINACVKEDRAKILEQKLKHANDLVNGLSSWEIGLVLRAIEETQ